MTYKISQEALNDLENIWLYTVEKWSVEQAEHYVGLLMDEIEYLAKNPYYGRDYGAFRRGYFRLRVKSHLIFYKINLDIKEIEIVRILHLRMDIDTRLDD